MNEELHRRLVSVARLGRYVIYSEIAPLLGLDMSSPADRTEIGRLLGEVSVFEHQLGHPLLSAIVIHRDNNIPGPGFFQLAKIWEYMTGMTIFCFSCMNFSAFAIIGGNISGGTVVRYLTRRSTCRRPTAVATSIAAR